MISQIQQCNRRIFQSIIPHCDQHHHRFSNKKNSTFLNTFNSQTIRWAGHNKWSKIKHKKGAKDVNRAKIFSKATKSIRAAAKACGGDLDNLHLQSAIQAAKSIQVPKDRIENAIQNAKSSSSTELVSQRYDGHIITPSSGKVSVIIQTLTDNKNRTAANIRSNIRKSNGDILNTGANDWLFDHVGIALVHKSKENDGKEGSCTLAFGGISEEEEEALMECALDGGAIDVDFGASTDEHTLLKSDPTDLHPLVISMKNGGYTLSEFESTYLVKDDGAGGSATIQLDEQSTEHFENFIQKMDTDEDVSKVYHNASFLEIEN